MNAMNTEEKLNLIKSFAEDALKRDELLSPWHVLDVIRTGGKNVKYRELDDRDMAELAGESMTAEQIADKMLTEEEDWEPFARVSSEEEERPASDILRRHPVEDPVEAMRGLLERAAEKLQDYASERDPHGDMNDSLADEIRKFLAKS